MTHPGVPETIPPRLAEKLQQVYVTLFHYFLEPEPLSSTKNTTPITVSKAQARQTAEKFLWDSLEEIGTKEVTLAAAKNTLLEDIRRLKEKRQQQKKSATPQNKPPDLSRKYVIYTTENGITLDGPSFDTLEQAQEFLRLLDNDNKYNIRPPITPPGVKGAQPL